MELIVVDGIDGSGKSTVAEWIAEHYRSRGEKVLVRQHPSDSFYGRLSRRSLTSEGKMMRTVATIFFILDVLNSLRRLRGWKDHDKVIFVRYIMATAYLPTPLYRQGYEFFCKVLPIPERLLLVDVNPECALRRIEEREHEREMFENLRSLEKVRGKVLDLSSRGWKVLDNCGSVENTRSQLKLVLSDWDALN
ncbi:MAG TPA: thymidylate kinase [Methanomassiliicoccales archaeon]|nr:thymidylate kinase [Methanomassiliicoccales archaeon]HPR97985.1 thymidylate kinase [Methanomassiliicoccales archaeon]